MSPLAQRWVSQSACENAFILERRLERARIPARREPRACTRPGPARSTADADHSGGAHQARVDPHAAVDGVPLDLARAHFAPVVARRGARLRVVVGVPRLRGRDGREAGAPGEVEVRLRGILWRKAPSTSRSRARRARSSRSTASSANGGTARIALPVSGGRHTIPAAAFAPSAYRASAARSIGPGRACGAIGPCRRQPCVRCQVVGITTGTNSS